MLKKLSTSAFLPAYVMRAVSVFPEEDSMVVTSTCAFARNLTQDLRSGATTRKRRSLSHPGKPHSEQVSRFQHWTEPPRFAFRPASPPARNSAFEARVCPCAEAAAGITSSG